MFIQAILEIVWVGNMKLRLVCKTESFREWSYRNVRMFGFRMIFRLHPSNLGMI
jgi:hypothetical protein